MTIARKLKERLNFCSGAGFSVVVVTVKDNDADFHSRGAEREIMLSLFGS